MLLDLGGVFFLTSPKIEIDRIAEQICKSLAEQSETLIRLSHRVEGI